MELICDHRVMIDLPSRLPDELVAAGRGRRMVLHHMHGTAAWLAFGVWEDGRLVRSMSLPPDSGSMEDVGELGRVDNQAGTHVLGEPPARDPPRMHDDHRGQYINAGWGRWHRVK
ncbi:hypothetical protein AB0O82_29815 [Kitasatospora sp. NPDC088264]|uniref:DUF6928 family protein n=1 Tax=Kitasatospora sp. NPDC088264 TaxID=3155296 RepID=UPI00341AA575